jgi:hypothetical protein
MYNFLHISFPDSGVETIQSYRTELTLNRYQHEHLTMYIQNWGLEYSQVKAGSPVQATIKSPLGTKEFVGYVHRVKPDITPNKQFTEITAIGATYTMKQAAQKVWTKVTADQVIKELAKKHNMSYHCTPHPRIYDHLVQSGETDWEFMCKLAYRSGYTLRAEGTAIYCDPMTKDFEDHKSNAPYFVMRPANHPDGFNIYSFRPEIGESEEHDGSMKAATAVGGINIDHGDVLVKTNKKRPATTKSRSQSEFYDRFKHTSVVPNDSVANAEALAADERARYPYRGHVEVMGDARLRPDLPIFLDGVGGDYSGYWTILEATHVFTETMYTVQMTVGTDSLGQSTSVTQIPNKVPQRVISPNSAVKTKPAISKLVKNTKVKNNSGSNSGFGKTNNRAQPKVGNSTKAASAKWVGTSGNLKTQPAKNNANAAVVSLLRSKGVR